MFPRLPDRMILYEEGFFHVVYQLLIERLLGAQFPLGNARLQPQFVHKSGLRGRFRSEERRVGKECRL